MKNEDFGLAFCRQYNVDFCSDKGIDFCPCRFIIDSVKFCSFSQFVVELDKEKGNAKYRKFLRLICEQNRQLLEILDVGARDVRVRLAKAVEDIKEGNIRVGDIVYCIKEGDNVTVLELPSKEHFEIYNEFGVFPGDMKYQISSGETKYAALTCFNRIHKGTFSNEYIIEGKNIQNRVRQVLNEARRNGYRVENQKIGDGYKLTVFGDSQQDVDNFIELCSMARIF